jgi:hypothetical protein
MRKQADEPLVYEGLNLKSPEIVNKLKKLKENYSTTDLTVYDKRNLEKVKMIEYLYFQLTTEQQKLEMEIRMFNGSAKREKEAEVELRKKMSELDSMNKRFQVTLDQASEKLSNPTERNMKELTGFKQTKEAMILKGRYAPQDSLVIEEILHERKKKLQGDLSYSNLDSTKATETKSIPKKEEKKKFKGMSGVSDIEEKALENVKNAGKRGKLEGLIDSTDDAVTELEKEIKKKEEEISNAIGRVEATNSKLSKQREAHLNFVDEREQARKMLQMNLLIKEMQNLKRDEEKANDVEQLRKSYFGMLLHTYELEKNVLEDQVNRKKDYLEVETKARHLDLDFKEKALKGDLLSKRANLILDMNQKNLQNQYLEEKIKELKNPKPVLQYPPIGTGMKGIGYETHGRRSNPTCGTGKVYLDDSPYDREQQGVENNDQRRERKASLALSDVRNL